MSRGPELPTVDQLAAIAQDFGLEMTQEDLANQREAVLGAIRSLRHIDDVPEERPLVTYPRTSGYRPHPDENPYNAWYWRTDIKGADSGPLAGEAIGIKDVVSVAGVPMMNGARVLEGYVPTIDATIVTRLLDAGATIVGKTACADFSFSGGGHTSGYGPVRNPRKPTHAPGGSSKGSGAAVAAGDVAMAIGGDQGGSIRIPASWCGVVGHKATYGLIPYTGCLAIEMTLDHIGPMTDTVENTARMLSVLAGPDPLDPRQRGTIPANHVQDYMPAIGAGCEGIRVGVLTEGFGQTEETWPEFGLPGSDPAVDGAVRAAVRRLEERGAQVTEVSVPLHFHGLRVWFAIAAEGATEFMLKAGGVGTGWF
ncbi:MAG: amidase family protein, partial [Rhodospirillales bacterium]|nr:amidase family protein [Rhodospirillales bacterium]